MILAACGAGVPAKTASTDPGATATAGPTATSTPTAMPTPTDLPGLEGQLVFARFTESTHTFNGMFTSAPDGSNELSIPMPGTEGGGRWSPSGDEIAVATTLADGRIGTAILAPDGTVLRELGIEDPTLNLACVFWFPEGTRIGCEGWDDSDSTRAGIYSVSSMDGSDLRRLTETPAGMTDLPGDISIDGQLIFKRGADAEGDTPLWLVPVAGGEAVQLTQKRYGDPGRFSPDGQLIATGASGRIVILDREGTETQRFDLGVGFQFGPDWAPDGEWIVFSSDATGFRADLFIAPADGSARYQVTATPDNEINVDWGVAP
jgi:Tol biopolymer transport system component